MRSLLLGDKVIMNSIKDEDIKIIENWFNDIEFLRFYDMLPALPKTNKEVKEIIDYYTSSKESCIFAVRDIKSNQIIGLAGFDEIIWNSSVATVFIGIGDRENRGRGFGKETLKLLLDFGFNELNFHRLQLNVIQYNYSAIKLYESEGFKREGVYRDFILRDGKRYDMYLYGLLRKEWTGL